MDICMLIVYSPFEVLFSLFFFLSFYVYSVSCSVFMEKHDLEYVKLQEENRERAISHQPVQQIRKPIVTLHFYHDLFVTEFNIYFGYPRSDTCDSIVARIGDAPSPSVENGAETTAGDS